MNSGVSTARLSYIDMAKGLGILLITYGHITTMGNPVDTWMSLFKITIFFVVSGYLTALRGTWKTISPVTYVVKLLRSLMLPYLSFSIISMTLRVIRNIIRHKDFMPLLKTDLLDTLTLRGISTLWFLPCMFLGELIFFLILRLHSKPVLALSLVWPVLYGVYAQNHLKAWTAALPEAWQDVGNALIIMLSKALVSVWFFLIGYLGYLLLTRLPQPPLRFALGIALSIATLLLSFTHFHIDFNMMNIGKSNPLPFFLGGVIGSFGAILTFEWLSKYWKLELLTYYGRNSLILMAVQRSLMFINLVVAGWEEFVYLEDAVCARYYAETLAILAIVLLMSFGVIEFINQKTPFIIGKKRLQLKS